MDRWWQWTKDRADGSRLACCRSATGDAGSAGVPRKGMDMDRQWDEDEAPATAAAHP